MSPVLSLCPAPRCRTLTLGGRCEPHRQTENRRRHRKQRAQGRDAAAWRQDLRAAALERDGGRCALRVDDGCTGTATTVHLDERLQGRHDLATLVDCSSACAHCHGVVDAPRAAAARAARPGRLAESLDERARPAPSQPPARNVHHAVAAEGNRR